MQMNDTRRIEAPQDIVWAALLDPEVLRACIPGCTELTGDAEQGYAATVVQKVGPVKATFKGTVTLSEVDAPNAVTLTGEGKGGAAGFAKGGARVTLAPDGDATELSYTVDAKVGGKLAQLGGRIIDGFAKKMAQQFFDGFQAAVEPAPDPVEAEGEDADAEAGEVAQKGWFRRMVNR